MARSTVSTPRKGRRTRLVIILLIVLAVSLVVPRLREWAWVIAILIVVTPIGPALMAKLRPRR